MKLLVNILALILVVFVLTHLREIWNWLKVFLNVKTDKETQDEINGLSGKYSSPYCDYLCPNPPG
ncbi:hypothetical protein DHCNIT_0003040 [Dehalococcoides mccartyi]|jgi:hypothetical protein|nr:hypothetical protein Dm11a5_0329 [Dehalococcoides mccartyi]MBA2084767.1 hypothetical protein [Dehalococcoides mccartyi]BCT55541.1 hypothetical protein DHCNIT_0003040 [Dehalococcoides mccartyi]BEL00428.1 hypothetical protein DMOBY_02810 [Dehalococcoides mccartyi]